MTHEFVCSLVITGIDKAALDIFSQSLHLADSLIRNGHPDPRKVLHYAYGMYLQGCALQQAAHNSVLLVGPPNCNVVEPMSLESFTRHLSPEAYDKVEGIY